MRKKVLWKRRFLHFCTVLALFALTFTPPFIGQAGGGVYGLTNCVNPTPAGTCPPG